MITGRSRHIRQNYIKPPTHLMINTTDTLKTPASITVPHQEISVKELSLMVGPCAVEDLDTLYQIATSLKQAGVNVLRGGAFKPRTAPDSFQGLGETGLRYLRQVADEVGMTVVTEAMDTRHVELVVSYTDIIQVGSRNMHNSALLREVGRSKKPVLLKRGMSATLSEFVQAANYIIHEGNNKIIFCERGIRTISDTSRFTLDLAVIHRLKELGDTIVIVDPSHSSGESQLVPKMAKAAIAAGADGLLIEVHPDPRHALCDGRQAVLLENFPTLADELRQVYAAVRHPDQRCSNNSNITAVDSTNDNLV
ncbi:3-deoxy-7-phosphoheptulonate synthase [Planctomycetota bacterium]